MKPRAEKLERLTYHRQNGDAKWQEGECNLAKQKSTWKKNGYRSYPGDLFQSSGM